MTNVITNEKQDHPDLLQPTEHHSPWTACEFLNNVATEITARSSTYSESSRKCDKIQIDSWRQWRRHARYGGRQVTLAGRRRAGDD